MNQTLAWLLICAAAFVSGAWWQRTGCDLRQAKAQQAVLKDDVAEIKKTVEPVKQRLEVAHAKTLEIIKTTPDACLVERVPAAIADRLRNRGKNEQRPPFDG